MIVLGFLASMVMSRRHSPEAMTTLMAIWLTGVTLHSIGKLAATLYEHTPLCVYSVLPVPDDAVFLAQFWKFSRSTIWLVVTVAVIWAAYVLAHDLGIRVWLTALV